MHRVCTALNFSYQAQDIEKPIPALNRLQSKQRLQFKKYLVIINLNCKNQVKTLWSTPTPKRKIKRRNFFISSVKCFPSNKFQPSLSFFQTQALYSQNQYSALHLCKHIREMWLLVLRREANTSYLLSPWNKKLQWHFSHERYNWKVFIHAIYFTYWSEK